MIKVFWVAILFFTINYSFAQKSEGIIYDYKKNQAILAFGNSGNVELGYFRRFTKNFSVGLSISMYETSYWDYSYSYSYDTSLNMNVGYSDYQYYTVSTTNILLDLKYNFLVEKRLQPSIILSPGIDVGWSEGFTLRYAVGIDYHFKSDNHVITLMSNNFQNDYMGGFNNVSLRYSFKF